MRFDAADIIYLDVFSFAGTIVNFQWSQEVLGQDVGGKCKYGEANNPKHL